MENNISVRTSRSWLSYEKIYPIAIAFCTIMMAIWTPITIANSYIIHNAETNNILTGGANIAMVEQHKTKAMQLKDRIKKLDGQNKVGPKGEKGPLGEKGEKGVIGEGGIFGIKGRKGTVGRTGPLGNDGETGNKGEPGVKGLKGNSTGDPGLKGPKGPNGEKGDGPPTPSLPKVYNITRAFKGDKKVYQTFCWDTCRDITVKLSYQGDADLYANEGSPPRIKNSNCDDCLCKSRSSSSPDTCYITTAGENSFYTTVYAHDDYRNAQITFDGPNFNDTIVDNDDSRECSGESCDEPEETTDRQTEPQTETTNRS